MADNRNIEGKIHRCMDAITSFFLTMSVTKLIRPIMDTYQQLERPVNNKDLKLLIDEYHLKYLRYGWEYFFVVLRSIIILGAVLAYLFMSSTNDNYKRMKIIMPLLFSMITIFNYLVTKYEKFLRVVYPLILLFFSVVITHQNLKLKQYRIYEAWLFYYFLSLFITIIH